MKPYLEYSKTFADDPESDVEGRIYNGDQLREIFGDRIHGLISDFFNHPYLLKLSYFPDDLTRYEIKAGQESESIEESDAHSCYENEEWGEEGKYCAICGRMTKHIDAFEAGADEAAKDDFDMMKYMDNYEGF